MRRASAVLGSNHPFVRTTERLESVERQALGVAAVSVGSAAVVLLELIAISVACRDGQRDQAIALILEGREDVPVAAVQDQRRRLLDGQTRTTLARNFEVMIDQASPRRRSSACRIPPLFDRSVVVEATDDLLVVIRLLRAGDASARGVALAE